MDSTIVWIVVVIAAILVLAALGFAARNKRNQRRHIEAESIREDVTTHIVEADKREALADETAARARAAEAEAEVKAAEAARLTERASGHREAVTASREDLDERRKDADRLDPKTRVDTDDDVRDDAGVRAQESTARHEAERK